MITTIVDDTALESTESFTAQVEISNDLSNRFRIEPSVKVVNITDNDGRLYIMCVPGVLIRTCENA